MEYFAVIFFTFYIKLSMYKALIKCKLMMILKKNLKGVHYRLRCVVIYVY